MTAQTYPLLERVDTPAEVRRLNRGELRQLAQELRAYLLATVSKTGGHLSSNLGTVELTIALHHVFETPRDRLVWDVGHQSYPHKILTGRREAMPSLRQLGGLSGFPRRVESEYDTFGTAHASTSISAALGMAVASRNLSAESGPRRRRHVAVIGDGAMSGGMAFEAMNNAGVTADIDLLVILNDNDMSISPAVGALNRYLARLLSGRFFAAARSFARDMLAIAPPVLEIARRLEEHAKGMVSPATMFEEFGFNYVGPIDGHDLDALVPTLQNLRELRGPQFLHVVTRKGAGYQRAEADPIAYHGPGKFDPAIGLGKSSGSAKPTFTQIFGQWVCDQAQADARLVAVTPAMREGSGLVEFERRFPQRYFDVGIAEQHAVTFAAGMACEGLKPVVAIYSTFLQRGYDQLIHDVALQNLPVLFAIDRAGLVGADGATHAGAYDLAYLRCIPNLVVLVPSDEAECRAMLSAGFAHNGPVAVRYPRGAGVGAEVGSDLEPLPIGKGKIRRQSSRQSIAQGGPGRVAILAFGPLLHAALAAAAKLDVTVVDMRCVKPLDQALLLEMAAEHDALVTLEEHAIAGGAGSACAEALAAAGVGRPLKMLGLPDRFIDHGDHQALLALEGLDAAGVERSLRKEFGAWVTA